LNTIAFRYATALNYEYFNNTEGPMAKKLSKEQIFLNTINAPGYVPYQVLNGTITWNAPYQFSDGSPRPKCINTGCNNPVVCSKGNENSAPSAVVENSVQPLP
jgi:hypothetical protein